MPKYRNGLIVGKFSPLHKGHEYLIRRALGSCERLFVFSYSNPEFSGYGAEVREKWLRELFPSVESYVLTEETTKSQLSLAMPADNDSESAQRRFVADLWMQLVGLPLDVVFTSEHYGDGFAVEMTTYLSALNNPAEVRHHLVDLDRTAFPISGTELRADMHNLRHFMSPCVYSSFVKRVCFLGGESTGKSTLASEMAKRFDTAFVPEYGRTLWEEKGGKLEFEDLLTIAETHLRLEQERVLEANRFLFIDTSPLTTMLYSEDLFGRVAPKLETLSHTSYDHIFLCSPDFPFVQDGTRAGAEFRDHQHRRYIEQLERRRIGYTELTGSIEERINAVMAKLN
jgi:NadR type nicotinamide-nucleotide adenylyltransferase